MIKSTTHATVPSQTPKGRRGHCHNTVDSSRIPQTQECPADNQRGRESRRGIPGAQPTTPPQTPHESEPTRRKERTPGTHAVQKRPCHKRASTPTSTSLPMKMTPHYHPQHTPAWPNPHPRNTLATMRPHTITPDHFKHPRISQLTPFDTLTFIGLTTYVASDNQGWDHLPAIATHIFPDDCANHYTEVAQTVDDSLTRLHDARLITRDNDMITLHDPIGTTPTTSTPKKKAQEPDPHHDDDFDAFWQAYPRKADKKRARLAYDKARERANAQTIHDGAARYAHDTNRDPGYTKLPTTWLNGDHWDDEDLPASTNSNAQDRRSQQIYGLLSQVWTPDSNGNPQEIESA